jgi:hypothetical protein
VLTDGSSERENEKKEQQKNKTEENQQVANT